MVQIMKRIQKRKYFLSTKRIGFSEWGCSDLDLAELLWGNPQVTKYICATGVFSKEDIAGRLDREIENREKYQVQYWPIFDLKSDELIGCCGLRPYAENGYEIGIHLRPEFWRQGYAKEAAKAVIDFAFNTMNAALLFAGHNPNNTASQKLLHSLGFVYVGDEFYEPTGLYHPSYKMENPGNLLGK